MTDTRRYLVQQTPTLCVAILKYILIPSVFTLEHEGIVHGRVSQFLEEPL